MTGSFNDPLKYEINKVTQSLHLCYLNTTERSIWSNAEFSVDLAVILFMSPAGYTAY